MTLALQAERPTERPRTRRSTTRRQNLLGWLFVGPFAFIFLALLVLPLAYAFFLSTFQKALIGGSGIGGPARRRAGPPGSEGHLTVNPCSFA